MSIYSFSKSLFITITSLLLPVILVITSLDILVRYDLIYEYNMESNDTPLQTGLSEETLRDTNDKIRDYFYGDQELLDVAIYSSKEILHMQDVKSLINFIFNFGRICSIIFCIFSFVLFYYFSVQLVSIFKYSLYLFSCLLIFLGLGFIFLFNQIFLIFHQISFTNDLWILNPETDFLLIMFPESFFRDVAIMIVVLAILINLLLFLSIRKLKQYI
ncbi:MAG: TIGR01906 family membrane protein [Chloroflexota bacterium]